MGVGSYLAGVSSVFSSLSAVTSKVAIFALPIFETEKGSAEQLPSKFLRAPLHCYQWRFGVCAAYESHYNTRVFAS